MAGARVRSGPPSSAETLAVTASHLSMGDDES